MVPVAADSRALAAFFPEVPVTYWVVDLRSNAVILPCYDLSDTGRRNAMDSLPSWARRKILDGFVRRWARAQLRSREFPLSDTDEVPLAFELLSAGSISECAHEDLPLVVEQVVLLRMVQMENALGCWQEFVESTKSWAADELLPKQAIAYAHFAAAEECLRQGRPASALAWATRAPLSLYLIGRSEKTITWPQVHHVRALAAIVNGDMASAEAVPPFHRWGLPPPFAECRD